MTYMLLILPNSQFSVQRLYKITAQNAVVVTHINRRHWFDVEALTFLKAHSYRGHSQEYTMPLPVLLSAFDMFM